MRDTDNMNKNNIDLEQLSEEQLKELLEIFSGMKDELDNQNGGEESEKN